MFASLYRYFPAVRKYVREHGGGNEEAKDAFQEGLLVFYQKTNRPGFILSSKPETFLFGICKLKWLEKMKQKGKEIPVGEALDDMAEQPEENERERRAMVAEKALEGVGKKCKEILMAFYFGKKNISEIMKTFGFRSEDSAKTQKYKCLESARELVTLSLQKET